MSPQRRVGVGRLVDAMWFLLFAVSATRALSGSLRKTNPASSPPQASLLAHFHFDMAKVTKILGLDRLKALQEDARCHVNSNATLQLSSNSTDAGPAHMRCLQLCENKEDCANVCEEVRAMICNVGPTVITINNNNPASLSAAAAAAATSATKDAVKGAIMHATRTAMRESELAKHEMSKAMWEAGEIAKHAAEEAATDAATQATKLAHDEAAHSSHEVASTAAAAASAAAHQQMASASSTSSGSARRRSSSGGSRRRGF